MSTSRIHLVQLAGPGGRRVAVVEEPELLLLQGIESVYELASRAIAEDVPVASLIGRYLSTERINYDDVYQGTSPWTLIPPIDVPEAEHRVMVAGTGLTHYGSARERQAMHVKAGPTEEDAATTDSMRMFEWGRQQGRPDEGKIGIAPEWFYKGSGAILRAHNAKLEVPGYAEDGGEEAEVAAIYIISADGTPVRLGMCNGNEFSDHVFERRNYLNLAGSKLRVCSIGPELVIDAAFDDLPGRVQILRDGASLWEKKIRTGEENMCHSLANLEHHHFKFEDHRRPGDVHVHFFGADTLSFGEGVRLQADDVTVVEFEGMGRALRNTIAIAPTMMEPVRVKGLR